MISSRALAGTRCKALLRQVRGILGTNVAQEQVKRQLTRQSLRGFASSSDKDPDKDLRVNIRMLGNTLGNIVKSTDPEVFDAVERLREKSRSWRSEGGNPDHFEDMVNEIASFDNKKLKGVARAFTHFLALANSAENHHRVRRLRERMMSTGEYLFADLPLLHSQLTNAEHLSSLNCFLFSIRSILNRECTDHQGGQQCWLHEVSRGDLEGPQGRGFQRVVRSKGRNRIDCSSN